MQSWEVLQPSVEQNVLLHMPCRQYCCPAEHLCRDVLKASEAKRFNDRTSPKAEPSNVL